MESEKPKKLKMSGRTFKRIWITVIVVILALAVALTVAGNSFASVLDSYLGGGHMVVKKAPGTSAWNTTYNAKATNSMQEAKTKSDAVSQRVTDEGIVMLKNDGVLPLKEQSIVSPFGAGYMDPAYSGSGAAATTDKEMITSEQGLKHYFKVNDATVQAMKGAKTSSPGAAPGTKALNADKNSVQAIMDKGKSAHIDEYDPSIYTPLADKVKDTTGIVFIKRSGSEGIDKRTQGYDDGTPHYLALTAAEKNTIKFAKDHCASVIVVLNSANPMELTPIMGGEFEADAIVWTGTTGSRGFESLGRILSGKVNPSGRLTDTYPTDFTKDPTFANFGEYHYTNTKVKDQSVLGDFMPGANRGTIDRPYVEYEEGIYVGYRYYETASVEDPDFIYGRLNKNGGIVQPGAVAYPFGYGMSYTSFDRKLKDVQVSGGKVEATVEVKNTGKVAGKDTVQLYYTAPYTDYDRSNHVEKSATELGAFAKTKLLQPGAGQEIKLKFSEDDMASYDYHHRNHDGSTGAYLLEAGNYMLQLKNNSHDVLDTYQFTVANTQFYEGNNPRQSDKDAQSKLNDKGEPTGKPEQKAGFKAPSNRFQTMNAYMDEQGVTQLSRSNWKGTFPTAPEGRKGVAPQVALDEFSWFDKFDPDTDKVLGNDKASKVYQDKEPNSKAKHDLALIDLRGEDYNSKKWDQLLDQIDWQGDKKSITEVLFKAAYQTAAIPSIDKPATVDKDGAMGWSIKGASSWAGANVIASTWNVNLLKEMGEALGEEGLQSGLNAWYAPGVNTHRSPFSGRVYEYYSEDGLLSGKLAAASISGAGNKGIFSYLKHFALNEQETFRDMYLATWANEQAVREIYLKPFEIAVKEARSTEKYIGDSKGTMTTKVIRSATGIMSSQNSIGGVIGFAHRGLLTDVLRGEWGFHGAVITDLYPTKQHQLRDMTLRAGNDLFMNQMENAAKDYDSPTARMAMRKALHNIGYATVNSNAMNGITPRSRLGYSMSPWKKLLYGIDVAIVVVAALIVFWIVRRGLDEKANPDRYKKPKSRKKVKA